jgi:trans-2,3-dihydro-3-hydroxyanthranilate isomerase
MRGVWHARGGFRHSGRLYDTRGLSSEERRLIAWEFSYSETALVLPPQDADDSAQLRIFTPIKEIPSPAIQMSERPLYSADTITALARRPASQCILNKGAGLVSVDLLRQQGAVVGARINAKGRLEVLSSIAAEVVASCISLDTSDMAIDAHRPTMVSVGLPFVVAEASLDGLRRARPNSATFGVADSVYPHAVDCFSVFFYPRTGQGIERLRARMFAPLNNICEDPATGSASAALGACLALLDPQGD